MRWMLMLVALSMIGLSIWQFEAERAGLEFTPLEVEGDTPATLYATSDAGQAPPVVIAHGFAGLRRDPVHAR